MAQPNDNPDDGVLDLVEAVVTGTGDDDSIPRLDALLASSSKVRSLFLDYVDLHSGLRRRFANPADGTPYEADRDLVELASNKDATPGGSYWRYGISMMLAVSACLAGIWLAGANTPEQEAAPVLAKDQQASLNGVAVLTRGIGIEWTEGKTQHRVGAALPTGSFEIESGVAQIEFYSGAVAVVEGPAKLDLASPMKGYLRFGKLRTRVPPGAKGFTIETDSGHVVDLGTEFTIDVSRGGDVKELHVLDGEIEYHANNKGSAEPMSLFRGDALRLEEGSLGKEKLKVSKSRFIGLTELESLAREEASARHATWLEWQEELLNDPALIGHYAYSPEASWQRTLRNFAPDADDDTHGAVVGCEWTAGRWPESKALRFRNASHRVSLHLPGEYDSLSLVTWIAIDRFHPTNKVGLLHPEIGQSSVIHWTLDRVPLGAVLHFAESAQPDDLEDRHHYSSVEQGMFNEDVGQWVQVAVVYDPHLRRVSHYRNGKLVGWQPIHDPRPVSIGAADLGNWPYKDWAAGTVFETRNLIGRLDEFLIYKRPLSGSEIQKMYEVGKP